MNRLVGRLYYIWHLKLTWDIGVRLLDNTIIKVSDTGKKGAICRCYIATHLTVLIYKKNKNNPSSVLTH